MDLKHLREQARGFRMNANGLRQQATRLMDNAAAHIKEGNPDRAQAEQAQATKLNDDAADLDAKAVAADSLANGKEEEVQAIEAEQPRLQQEFNQRMNDLDKQKTNLIGASTSLF